MPYTTVEYLRQFLIVHCYGVYAFNAMLLEKPYLFKDAQNILYLELNQSKPPGKKRENTYWVIELGKNISPVKVWIPKRLRDDIQILADHVGIKLSQYLREIVISRLLGNGTLPMRPEMIIPNPPKSADAWCEGIEEPWQQVSYEKYCDASVKKIE